MSLQMRKIRNRITSSYPNKAFPMSSLPPTSPTPAAGPGPMDDPGTPVVESTSLLKGRPEVVILHNGREYRLRHTRLGKLILTA